MLKILGLMTCYNRKEKTLESICRLVEGNPTINFEFVIADDCSTDGTADELKSFRKVTVLPGTGALFYSGGMRRAIEYALNTEDSYDFCLLFNDDVKFFSNSITKLASKDITTVWIGPTCDSSGQLSYGGVIRKSIFRPSFKIVRSEKREGLLCDTFNANCVLIPWKIFCKIGNFDPVYSHSLGDFDYGFMISNKGYELKVDKDFVGECCDNPITGSWRDPSLTRFERIKKKENPKGLPRKEWFYYLRKNYNLGTALLYSLIPYAKILLKI